MSAHGKTHWIKLYVEMNHDPKIGLLTDDLKWRFVSVLLLAGELNEDGFLPETDEMAWQLRIAPETLAGQLRTLAGRGLVELRLHPDGGERWFVSKFTERQSPSSNAERQKQWRKRNAKGNTSVTKRNAKVTPEYRIQNTETEEEDRARAQGPGDDPPDSLLLLQNHFATCKAIHPNDRTGTYERNWRQPLKAILDKAGGDVSRAMALIDAALEVAAGHNEQGKVYTVSSPRSLAGIIANLPVNSQEPDLTPDSIWQRAVAAITSGRPPTDDPPLFHAIRDVGWTAIQAADKYTEKPLKNRLFAAYRSAPA